MKMQQDYLEYSIKEEDMLTYSKDDFDESLEDIMESVNSILNKTGKGYETKEDSNENKNENKNSN